jgi:Xaa-Pro dipeptidase
VPVAKRSLYPDSIRLGGLVATYGHVPLALSTWRGYCLIAVVRYTLEMATQSLLNEPRARQWMEQAGLDAVIACSPANVRYLTGHHIWFNVTFKRHMLDPREPSGLPFCFALLANGKKPSLVLEHLSETNTADLDVDCHVYGQQEPVNSGPWITHESDKLSAHPFVRTRDRYESPFDALVAALRAHGLTEARLGFEFEPMISEDQVSIRKALPNAQLRDASQLFRMIRMVKTPVEQDLLRHGFQIAERAAARSFREARVGTNLTDLAHIFRTQIAADGADFDHYAYSPFGLGIATEPSYTISDGEVLFLDFGCVYRQYYTDAGTSLFVGSTTAEDERVFEVLLRCLETTQRELRPGVLSSRVQAVMAKVFADGGLIGEFPHGHGLGLEVRDFPILVPDHEHRIRDDCIDVPADFPLETGMVLSLEAPVFRIPGKAFQLEQSFIVTPDGGTPLTDRDLTTPARVLS